MKLHSEGPCERQHPLYKGALSGPLLKQIKQKKLAQFKGKFLPMGRSSDYIHKVNLESQPWTNAPSIIKVKPKYIESLTRRRQTGVQQLRDHSTLGSGLLCSLEDYNMKSGEAQPCL